MAEIVSQPDGLSFTSSIADVVFRTSEASAVVVLGFTTADTTKVLSKEIITPGPSGCIRVADLSTFLEPYSREYGVLHCYCQLQDNIPVSAEFTVLPGFVDVGESAARFVEHHFLTILDAPKLTSLMRTEWISAYGFSTVRVLADVRTIEGQWQTLQCDLPAEQTTDGISRFDVSPARIADTLAVVGGEITGYTVANIITDDGDTTLGQARQHFIVIPENSVPGVAFLFQNSFGCEEFLYCTGALTRSTDFERQQTRFGNMQRTTAIDEKRKFEVSTGWMPDGMSEWALDLMRCRHLWLWQNSQRSHEMIITATKDEYSNTDDALTQYEITYTYARSNQNMLATVKPLRIFSDEFSEVFC